MASRNLDDLRPEVATAARQHRTACAGDGIELLIYCTLRDAEEQARLYRQGRTPDQIRACGEKLTHRGFPQLGALLQPPAPLAGAKVTFAGPGESFHQYGMAYDCVPIIGGKPEWRTQGDALAVWQRVAGHGRAAGLEWAGGWTRFKEFPHFQLTGGRAIEDLMTEHHQAGPPAFAPDAAVADESESDVLRQALAEPNTQILVVASVPGAAEAELTELHRRAGVLRNLDAAVLRVLWVRAPDALAADLRQYLWAGAAPAPATVLYLGTGMARQVKTFGLAQLASNLDLTLAFMGEP